MSPRMDTRRVRLTRLDLVPGCTTADGAGIDSDGRNVLLRADWRTALLVADTLEGGDPVDVYLDDERFIAWRRA